MIALVISLSLFSGSVNDTIQLPAQAELACQLILELAESNDASVYINDSLVDLGSFQQYLFSQDTMANPAVHVDIYAPAFLLIDICRCENLIDASIVNNKEGSEISIRFISVSNQGDILGEDRVRIIY